MYVCMYSSRNDLKFENKENYRYIYKINNDKNIARCFLNRYYVFQGVRTFYKYERYV